MNAHLIFPRGHFGIARRADHTFLDDKKYPHLQQDAICIAYVYRFFEVDERVWFGDGLLLHIYYKLA